MNRKDQLLLKPGMVVVNPYLAFIRLTEVSKKKNGKIRAVGETLKDNGKFSAPSSFNVNKWDIL